MRPLPRDERIALILRARTRPPRRVSDLTRLHDALLYSRAFPEDTEVLDLAIEASRDLARMVRRLGARRARLEDSGIAGTATRYTFGFPITRWLLQSYSRDVDVDWPEVDDESLIDGLLRVALHPAEEDAFESGELSTRQWLALRRTTRWPSALSQVVAAAPPRGPQRDHFALQYDAAGVPIRWTLGDSTGAATQNLLQVPRIVCRPAMRRAPPDPVRFVASRMRAIELLSPRRAREAIHVARAALASRGREVHAMTYANERETYLADLGEGASIAIIGVEPSHRMQLEANYGYVLLSNGVPVGYGGVTPLYRQANTGINVFPSFRGSEASYLWLAALRAFHALFRIRRFVVNAYQFGAGNREAIDSGAFWFHYRLGFRPADRAVRAMAAREYRKLQRRGRHSTPAVLEHLARGDLWLDLPGFSTRHFFDERLLVECSRRATRLLAETNAGSMTEAGHLVTDRVRRMLGVSWRDWTRGERAGFARLAPVCALLRDVPRWGAPARAALVQVLRSKGSDQERDFAVAVQRARFFPELGSVLRRGARLEWADPEGSSVRFP